MKGEKEYERAACCNDQHRPGGHPPANLVRQSPKDKQGPEISQNIYRVDQRKGNLGKSKLLPVRQVKRSEQSGTAHDDAEFNGNEPQRTFSGFAIHRGVDSGL